MIEALPTDAAEKPLTDGLTQLSRQDAPILVVLDNVEDWAEKTRPHPLPKGSHVRLMVTTRNTQR